MPHGAKFWDEETDKEFYVAATYDKPNRLSREIDVGARVVEPEGITGIIVGFPMKTPTNACTGKCWFTTNHKSYTVRKPRVCGPGTTLTT